jgi:mono/diheme cytochrome c family protein
MKMSHLFVLYVLALSPNAAAAQQAGAAGGQALFQRQCGACHR